MPLWTTHRRRSLRRMTDRIWSSAPRPCFLPRENCWSSVSAASTATSYVCRPSHTDISELDGPNVYASGKSVLRTNSPIVQVTRCLGSQSRRLLVRTRIAILVGDVECVGHSIKTGPQYTFCTKEQSVPTDAVPFADYAWHSSSSAYLVDTHGSVQYWDLAAQKRCVFSLTQNPCHTTLPRRRQP